MENNYITEIVSRVVREMTEGRETRRPAPEETKPETMAVTAGNSTGRPTPEVTLRMAKKLMDRLEAEANRMGLKAVIAVVNKGARPVAVHCMDEAYIASFDVAMGKAYTSAALKMSTRQLKQLSQPGGELFGIQNTNGGQLVIFGGGVPITWGGKVIGGLGVSGGSEAQDTALAEYGEKIIKEALDLWQ